MAEFCFKRNSKYNFRGVFCKNFWIIFFKALLNKTSKNFQKEFTMQLLMEYSEELLGKFSHEFFFRGNSCNYSQNPEEILKVFSKKLLKVLQDGSINKWLTNLCRISCRNSQTFSVKILEESFPRSTHVTRDAR